MKHEPTQFEVETFSGRYFDCSNPRAEDVDLQDIAHSLSMTCRYGGHPQEFYSVATHSVFVSKRLERKGYSPLHQLAGLLHDATETYLGDIPRPIKPLLGDRYEELSGAVDVVICEALGLASYGMDATWFHDPIIKDSDNWSLFVEARHLLPSRGINWSGSQLQEWGVRKDGLPSRIVTPDYWKGSQTPPVGKAHFIARYGEIVSKIA